MINLRPPFRDRVATIRKMPRRRPERKPRTTVTPESDDPSTTQIAYRSLELLLGAELVGVSTLSLTAVGGTRGKTGVAYRVLNWRFKLSWRRIRTLAAIGDS